MPVQAKYTYYYSTDVPSSAWVLSYPPLPNLHWLNDPQKMLLFPTVVIVYDYISYKMLSNPNQYHQLN